MVEYRLLTYRTKGGRPQAGILVGDRVHSASTLLAGNAEDSSSVLALLQNWSAVRGPLRAAAARVVPEQGLALAELTLDAPILYPGAVFATGGIYPGILTWRAKKKGRPRQREP